MYEKLIILICQSQSQYVTNFHFPHALCNLVFSLSINNNIKLYQQLNYGSNKHCYHPCLGYHLILDTNSCMNYFCSPNLVRFVISL